MSLFNDGTHIWTVTERVACNVHGARLQEPCWNIVPLGSPCHSQPAVCGQRILKAGYNGVISPFSLRKTPEGPFNGRSKR